MRSMESCAYSSLVIDSDYSEETNSRIDIYFKLNRDHIARTSTTYNLYLIYTESLVEVVILDVLDDVVRNKILDTVPSSHRGPDLCRAH